MGWVDGKSVWFGCPYFADVFEGCEALVGHQPSAEIVGVDEVVEVCGQLGMAVVMKTVDGGLLDSSVHPFNLAVGPWVLDFGEPVIDPIFVAPHGEHVGQAGGCRAIGVTRRERELDAVVGQHGVDFVGRGFDQRDDLLPPCRPLA